jgi:hypothetical protein
MLWEQRYVAIPNECNCEPSLELLVNTCVYLIIRCVEVHSDSQLLEALSLI